MSLPPQQTGSQIAALAPGEQTASAHDCGLSRITSAPSLKAATQPWLRPCPKSRTQHTEAARPDTDRHCKLLKMGSARGTVQRAPKPVPRAAARQEAGLRRPARLAQKLSKSPDTQAPSPEPTPYRSLAHNPRPTMRREPICVSQRMRPMLTQPTTASHLHLMRIRKILTNSHIDKRFL